MAAMGWGLHEEGWRKGPWTTEEDQLLIHYVSLHGEGRWNSVSRYAGLKRNGKSCRLRWVNYLRPDLKKGQITPHEENIILELHARWGNRWSTIARNLPGRTDNEIKNYWRTHYKNGKVLVEYSKKAKTRLIRRQLFQQQQQQLQQQEEERQQEERNEDDMKRLMSLLHENGNELSSLAKESKEMVSMVSNTSEQHSSSSLFNGNASMLESPNEDIQWSGLWSMVDVHANMDLPCATSKIDQMVVDQWLTLDNGLSAR